MKIIVTGAAGFIGMHVSIKFLKNKRNQILGIDNLNNYYDVRLKLKRLNILKKFKNFEFKKIDITNRSLLNIFNNFKPDYVLHLAAQAGVRHSIKNPSDYAHSNLLGFSNILEFSKLSKVKHLVYASSSSVYGDIKKLPLKEDMHLNKPISYYGATKLCNELMAHSFSYMHKLPTTGLRFFTVYGPWGRPDMALFLFTKAIKKKKKIKLFNHGNMIRDFTYIDDISKSIHRIIKKIPGNKNKIPFRILNIGSNNPIKLNKYIKVLEKVLNKTSKKINLPMQKGDIRCTHANVDKLKKLIQFNPQTEISIGIKNFVNWYNQYYA